MPGTKHMGKKRPRKAHPPAEPAPPEAAPSDEPAPQYTTFRIFAEDGMRLSDLADWGGVTIAEMFRALFGDQLQRLYVDALRRRLRDHGGDRPG